MKGTVLLHYLPFLALSCYATVLRRLSRSDSHGRSMKYFKALIEQLRRQSSIPVYKTNSPNLNNPSLFIKGAKLAETFDALSGCQIFVFNNSLPIDFDIDVSDNKYDSPFTVWSIEVSGDRSLTVDHPQFDLRTMIPARALCQVTFDDQSKYVPLVLRLCEINYGGIISYQVMGFFDHNVAMASKYYAGILNSSESRFGTEVVSEKIKIGQGSNKRVHTIRKVVYVLPKSEVTSQAIEAKRNITWGHRWWIRGHWRSIDGIGKNRDGHYCVQGRTWVTEHVKGPEDLPLVNKTRVVLA